MNSKLLNKLAAVAGFTLLFLSACSHCFSQANDLGMRMHVINVGQAESIILELRDKAILIDAGVETPRKSSQNRVRDFRYRDNFREYLKSFFDDRPYLNRRFYGVVISHPHPDHVNNLKREVMKDYGIDTLIESGDVLDEYDYIDAANLGSTKHISLFDEDHANGFADASAWRKKILDDTGVEITFLNGWRDCNDENNFSLVVRAEYKTQSFLLTGDSEVDDRDYHTGQERCSGLIPTLLTRSPTSLRANVFKAGHHGSRNGTSLPWMNAIRPDYAVISAGDYSITQVGKYNAYKYGHPNEEAIRTIEKRVRKSRPTPLIGFTMTGPKVAIKKRTIKKAIYCTCWDGNITFTVNEEGEETKVDTQKK